jgi:hypothetical protein
MLELPMTAAHCYQLPSVFAQQSQNLADFHLTIQYNAMQQELQSS